MQSGRARASVRSFWIGGSRMRWAVVALMSFAGLAHAQPSPPEAAPPADWDLTPLFANAQAAAATRAAVEAELPALGQWRGKLSDPTALRAALDARSAVASRAQRYWMWATLRATRDGRDEAAAADLAAATDLFAKLEAATAYLEPELVALGDARLAALMAEPQLAPYRKRLSQLRQRTAHVLAADQEAMLATLQPLLRGSAGVRDTLFNVELPYPTITLNGAPQRLTPGGMRRVLANPDRASRQTAWTAFTDTQQAFKATQAALLSDYMSGVAWEAKTRRWASQVEMVTASDPMPASAFAALSAEAERAAKGPLARYMTLKARAIGVPALATYDLGAPFVPDTRAFTLEQANALTLSAVAPLGREYQDRLARGLSGRWIDWRPGPAKAPGGTTVYGVADLPGYISMSYNGTAASLALYAHEWGHWMHWEYSRESGLPAEAMGPQVSTNDLITFVHEMLVADQAIQGARSRAERIAALTSAIESLRTSYYAVVAQATFDLSVREAADRGVALTPDHVSDLYCQAHKRYSPPIVAWDRRDCLGWVTEPYAYYDLYFYRYLLATSSAAWFTERITAGDARTTERLKGLLRAGGSDDAPALFRQAGFDVADATAHAAMTRRMGKLTAALEKELASREPVK